MNYQKQGFYAGGELYASQLEAMEDGIINAERLAMEGAAGAANMEKGTGVGATQQLPDGVADGFDFTGKNANATTYDATLTGIIPYGATGKFASAFGGKCAAQGKRSLAEGTTTIAKGDYSHTEGSNTVALGTSSHAEGMLSTALGSGSHSEGNNTQALGDCSHAEGDGSKATGYLSHAEGSHTNAVGHISHAEGNNTQALGDCSHAEGVKTLASGRYSHVGGESSVAAGNWSFAHGCGVGADRVCQAVFGKYNTQGKMGSLFIVGNGTGNEQRSNAFEIYDNGLIEIGNKVQQLPDGVADGFDFTEKNPNATTLDPTLNGIIAYGATGEFASSFGGKSAAMGKRSHAEGTTTIARGDYSHSEGNATVALGANAHAEGAITTALGSTSHAEGQKTQAKGENSHAEGMSTIAEGRGSHSEGFKTKATGNHSHAEGYGSQALHDESHASGYYTKTGMPMQTVCGAYNVGRDNTFFEIGNGNEYKPENAFEVYTDNTIGIKYQGKTYSLQKILEALNAFGSNSIID